MTPAFGTAPWRLAVPGQMARIASVGKAEIEAKVAEEEGVVLEKSDVMELDMDKWMSLNGKMETGMDHTEITVEPFGMSTF